MNCWMMIEVIIVFVVPSMSAFYLITGIRDLYNVHMHFHMSSLFHQRGPKHI